MSFSSEVKTEVRNKCFTAKKRNSKIHKSESDSVREELIGLFLDCGHLSDPGKCYLLEFVCDSEEKAAHIAGLMSASGFACRLQPRKEQFTVCLQEADRIADFLSLTGAHRSLLAFENARIYKNMRETVQRKVNCETANLNKTVTASVRQISDIEYIEEHLGFDALPDPLRDIAENRLACPNATLQELAESLNPPIGKSGVNHRLRKLSKIAEELRADYKR